MVEQVPESVPATASLPPKAWKVLASNAGVALSQSEQEYAVYNQNSFLGTWPLTEEGYRYAVQTYEAHQQSPAHGVAYTATGYQDPMRHEKTKHQSLRQIPAGSPSQIPRLALKGFGL
jgi:hypothetical protein